MKLCIGMASGAYGPTTLTGAEPEQSSAVKTRLRLFRLAHMNDGHENGQASVLLLYSPPSKGFPCQYPQIMRRPFWKAAAPVPPALISFAYLRLWARGNSPEKRLP